MDRSTDAQAAIEGDFTGSVAAVHGQRFAEANLSGGSCSGPAPLQISRRASLFNRAVEELILRRVLGGGSLPSGHIALGCLLAVLAASSGVWAGQEQLYENVAPENAQQSATPLQWSFERAPGERPPNPLSDYLRKELQNTPAFIRDTELTLKPRTYFFEQEQPDGTIKESWAIGGSVEYRSGWLADHFRIGAEYFTSQPLYAPEDRDGTLLLKPGQEGYSVLGQAYGQLKFSDDEVLTAGASEYSTPYVNRQFNRMTPNTFEGVTMKGSFQGLLEKRRFDYLFGYLSKIKQRNSDEFVPMSQVLGTAEDAYGTFIAEALFSAWGASVGVAEYFTAQNLNIFYSEATWTPELGSKYGLKVSAQFTDERSVGGSLSLKGTPVSQNVGARATFSYERSVLGLAYSITDATGNVLSPWGSNPSYTNAAIKNANRAGEQSALASYSYSFDKLAPGLSAVAIYSYSWSAVDPSTGMPLANERELDLAVNYRVKDGPLKGLWLQLQRNGLVGAGDPEATKEWRAIVYWEVPLI